MLSLYVGGSQVGLRLRLETVAFSHARAGLYVSHMSWTRHHHNHHHQCILTHDPAIYCSLFYPFIIITSVILTTSIEGFESGAYIVSAQLEASKLNKLNTIE